MNTSFVSAVKTGAPLIILQHIYNITKGLETWQQIYHMLNTALVLNKIRAGAIINIPSEHQPTLIQALSHLNIQSKQYPFADKNNLLLYSSEKEPELQSVYDDIKPYDPANSPNTVNMENWKKNLFINTGKILEYYNPGDIEEIKNLKCKASIDTVISFNKNNYTINLIPQKIDIPNEFIFTDLYNKQTKIKKIQLPPGFKIMAASSCVSLAHVPAVGGKARKARNTRKLQRRKKVYTRRR
jgi:hypothetical protein